MSSAAANAPGREVRKLYTAPHMRLKTFGGPVLEGTTFSRPKSLLLLAYLAVEGAQSRQHLRKLFWPDVTDPAGNLRFVLSQVRAACPEAIHEEGQRLHLGIPSDVAELLGAFRSAPGQVPMLYRGAFLEGLQLDWHAELEEWVLLTREHFAGQVRSHLLRRASELRPQGASKEVSALLRQAWRLPGARPLDAEDLQTLYSLAVATGDELAGSLRQEARDLDLPLRDLTPPAPHEPDPARPGTLPVPPTSFVGREEELRELHALLDEPGTRLLTLLGPGGIGKTRLALELARQRPGPPPCHVALETVATPDLVPNAMALALGLKPSPAHSTLDLLKAGIGSQPLLLILDNFESVMEAGTYLADLLEACPGLHLLVTSRGRLGLPQETAYPLTGLSLTGGPDSEAAHLFVSRARQASARFRLTPDHAPAVARICEQVEGSPLGLELAAAWTRALTPQQITEELALGPGLLEESEEGKGRRSLKTIFEGSWARLTDEQRHLASALSVFAGGFTRADAAAVTEATLRPLLALVDAAFLSFSAAGRYTIHPLLRHFLREKLAAEPDRQVATESAFVAHFAARADDAWTGYYMRGEQQAVAAWGQEEYANLEAALVSAERRGELEQALRLAWFHSDGWINRGLMREGTAQLDRLLTQVTDREGQAYRRGLLTRSQLQLSMGEGGPDLAQALEEVAELSRQPGDGVCLSQALRARGILCAYAGDFGTARGLMQEAVQAAEAAAFPYGQASALITAGAVFNHLHDLTATREFVGRGVQIAEAQGFESLEGSSQILYAEALLNLGEYAAAEAACERGEPVLTRLNKGQELGFIFLLRGIAALWKSGADAEDHHLHLDEAERWLFRSAALRERGAVGGQMDLLRPGVGDVMLARGATEEARAHFQHALNAAQEKRDTAATMNAHHGLARLAHLEGCYPSALEHFRQMLTQTGNFIVLLLGLEGMAATVSRLGGHDVAVRAWGAADAFRRAHTLPVPPFFLAPLTREQAWTRARLGEVAYGRLFAAGEQTEVQEALASLLAWEGEEATAAPTSPG